MKATLESASDSLRSSVSSPGMPNTYLTPSASRHSTKTSEALRSAIAAHFLSELRRPQPRRRLAIATLVALATLLTAAAHATAASMFYIRRGGNGHGIGLSQYGAYGYAQHGEDYKSILAHYYQGTALATTNPRRIVRVLLST